ncbi:MAG: class I SAM-dependent methyltransferase, partial [Promethearchaeota archaeon]
MKTVKGIFDPYGVVYQGRSDDFFKEVSFSPIALGFIDGDHTREQVERDFKNIYNLLVDGGYIFLHDTYPPTSDMLTPTTCGNVYKFRQDLEDSASNRETKLIEVFTFPFGAMDVGFTMVRKLPVNRPYYRR